MDVGEQVVWALRNCFNGPSWNPFCGTLRNFAKRSIMETNGRCSDDFDGFCIVGLERTYTAAGNGTTTVQFGQLTLTKLDQIGNC